MSDTITLTQEEFRKRISDSISAASDYCSKNHNGKNKDCRFCRFDNAFIDAVLNKKLGEG